MTGVSKGKKQTKSLLVLSTENRLLPRCPNFRAITYRGLFPVTNDRGFHQHRIIEYPILFCPFVIHVLHIGDFLTFAVPVNQVVNPAYCPQDTVKFLAGHSVTIYVNRLELNSPLLKVPFCFFCVKAFGFSENLYIQY